MERVKDYKISKKYIIQTSKHSVGMQIKYKRNGYYYKVDVAGNEGLVEYLVTLVLKHSTVQGFVRYEYCRINDKYGCRSADFTNGGTFISAESLFMSLSGYEGLAEYIYSFRDEYQRYAELLKMYASIGINAEHYLKTTLYLDMLILNTDRHVKNYGILLNRFGRYEIAPIFDNGLSLNTVPDRNCSCTICGNFESQVIATGYPLNPPFLINYTSLWSELEKLPNEIKNTREFCTLCNQLQKYADIFAMKRR